MKVLFSLSVLVCISQQIALKGREDDGIEGLQEMIELDTMSDNKNSVWNNDFEAYHSARPFESRWTLPSTI